MSLAKNVLAVTYAEIALKGKNRPLFQRRLLNGLRSALRGEPVDKVQHVESRFLVWLNDPSRAKAAAEKLTRVFGVQWVSPAVPIPRDEVDEELKAISAVARELAIAAAGDARNFKVDSRRSDRTFPVGSPDINRIVGTAVAEVVDLPARMSGPDLTINVLVLRRHVLVFGEKQYGPGGLPAGSSGRAMGLLSGGIDSPVAAWMMMRRGCRLEFIHFHTGRSLAEADVGKIEDLLQVLARWVPQPLKLHLVPVVPYELRAIGAIPDTHDMVMFRRFMFLAAHRLARRQHCLGLVTGDSLGQVASQTIHNLAAISPDLSLPVYRPLIGMDKAEITSWSEKIGAYPVSIRPYRDCCSIRSPRPVLDARACDILEYSTAMDMEAAVYEALGSVERLTIDRDGRVETPAASP